MSVGADHKARTSGNEDFVSVGANAEVDTKTEIRDSGLREAAASAGWFSARSPSAPYQKQTGRAESVSNFTALVTGKKNPQTHKPDLRYAGFVPIPINVQTSRLRSREL